MPSKMNDDYPPGSPPWYPGPEPTPNEFRREYEAEYEPGAWPYANAGCTDSKCAYMDYFDREEWEYAIHNGARCAECGRPMKISTVFRPGERGEENE